MNLIETQNIGYKSDIGYQTFLYSNEHEIRRLLLYLVERISVDSDEKSSSPDHPSTAGWSIRPYDIQRRLKNYHPSTVWIPHSSDHIDDDDDDDEMKYSPDSDYYDYYSGKTSPNSIYGMYNLNNYTLQSFLPSNCDNQLAGYCRDNLKNSKMPIIPTTIIDTLEWNNHFWKNNIEHEENQSVDYMGHYLRTLCESKQTDAIAYVYGEDSEGERLIDSLMNEEFKERQSTDQFELKTNEQQIIVDKLRQELRECEKEIQQCKVNDDELARLESEYQERYKLFEASFKSEQEVFFPIDSNLIDSDLI